MLEVALEHYRQQKTTSTQAAIVAGRLWQKHLDHDDLDGSFREVLGPQLLRHITARQLIAAKRADDYTDQVLREQDLDTDAAGRIIPSAFAGRASDGRPLGTLLYEPVIEVKTVLRDGQSIQEASRAGLTSLVRIVGTQVADAGRVADGAALVTRPAVSGYVRLMNPPGCPRCAILAGKFFRWNRGFARHPHCKCVHIPSSEDHAGDLRTDPMKLFDAGQIRGLSAADTKAIQDGADIGQVVNAHRGMYTADAYGRRLKSTQEGVTVRGVAGGRLKASGGSYGKTPRPRPEAIYQLAGDDRAEALRLLERFGYISR